MWDLNDSPDPTNRDVEESEEYSDKGKRIGASVSNSSSSAAAATNIEAEDIASDEEEVDPPTAALRKRDGSRIFGYPVNDDEESPVTLQFFPEDGSTGVSSTSGFPRAHWVGVTFCHSDPTATVPTPAAVGSSPTDTSQPTKKSRRGPRSRSSQYRGVTFYRRTGRWESHIWFAPSFMIHFY